jgi:polyphosphate kinase 2 (PPK2 family)
MERLDNPEKHWKFSPADVHERKYWSDYMHAFQEAIRATASEHAPWYVVPADNKWFTRIVVSAVVIDALESLDLAYPKVDEAKRKELEAAKKILVAKK